MFPPEPSYHVTAGLKYSNIDEVQEKHRNSKYVKMIKIFTKEMSKSH